ncbi:MAG: SBBP repeat-containing protein, partial [bacterium]|nr:SBBP repeat-containing protein [Candidatus Kapabacteria bacterium]
MRTRPRRTRAYVITLLVLLASTHASAQFVPNAGQVIDDRGELCPEIAFTAARNNLLLYFQNDRVSYVLRTIGRTIREHAPAKPIMPTTTEIDTLTTYRVDVEFVGARHAAHPQGCDALDERMNFYYAHTGDGIRDVQPFRELIYRDLYPAIDLRYAIAPSGYKYEFIVRPGGNVSDIQLRYHGAIDLSIDDDGSVRVLTPMGELTDAAPVSFTVNGNDTTHVASRFVVHDDVLRIDVADYDVSQTLIVDPELIWATYCGGSGSEQHGAGLPTQGIDGDGATTMAAYTMSTNFPVNTGMLQTTFGGYTDDVLVRFRRNGTKDWSTYFGGSGYEYGGGVAVDGAGNVYHTGHTWSADLPVSTNAMQSSRAGASDSFIIKLDSNGTRIWSTYFGGSGTETYTAIALDSAEHFYLLTSSFSNDIATTGAFQTSLAGSSWNVAVARFDTSCTLRWCTLSGEGVAIGIAVDRDDHVFYSGHAYSGFFPTTTGAYQTTVQGEHDAFLASLDSTGSQRWATFIGGDEDDVGYGIATDDSLNVTLVGYTYSTDYPVTTGAFQTTNGGGSHDGFVSSFTSGGALRWSTYYGGSTYEAMFNAIADDAGNVTVSGWTNSTTFPVTTPELPGPRGNQDYALIRFDRSGERIWASRFGGSGYEYGGGVSL